MRKQLYMLITVKQLHISPNGAGQGQSPWQCQGGKQVAASRAEEYGSWSKD